MKKIYLYRTTLCTLIILASACSSDELIESQTSDKQITMTAQNFEFDMQSRTTFEVTPDNVKFTWAENDTVGIFPNEGTQAAFPMINGVGTNTASFNGGGWALKPSSTYAAYFPFNFYNRNLKEIPVVFEGQAQAVNASTAHLGAFDYMAAIAQTPQESAVKFEFKHLTSLVQLILTVPKKGKLDHVSLTSSEDIFITEGTIDLSAPQPTIKSQKKSNHITLLTKGIETTTNEASVQLYLMLAPVDLATKQIKVEFFNNDTAYTGSIEIGQLLPGKAYSYTIAAQQVSFEQSTFNVPAEGGQFTAVYHSNIPLYTENPVPETGPNTSIGTSDYWDNLYSDTSSQEIKAKVNVGNNKIIVDVAPAGFRMDKVKVIPLYNQFGDIVTNLTINQEGNPKVSVPLLGQSGISAWTNIMGSQSKAFAEHHSLEQDFIKTKEPISPSSRNISNLYGSLYNMLTRIHLMKEADEKRFSCYQPYIDTYLSLLNYTLIQCWGDVPYYEERPTDPFTRLPRVPIADIYTSLITKLEKALPYLEEKKNDSFTDVNSTFFVSKDVANILLGYILLDQKEYQKAITHLDMVINSGRYRIEETAANYHGNNGECILGYDIQKMPEILPCLDYKELLVMAAECYHCLNQDPKAVELLQQIATIKGIQLESPDVIAQIAQIRIVCELPYTIPFIRRNNIGNSVLGITSQHLLLWPIPQAEINANPSISQNPGY